MRGRSRSASKRNHKGQGVIDVVGAQEVGASAASAQTCLFKSPSNGLPSWDAMNRVLGGNNCRSDGPTHCRASAAVYPMTGGPARLGVTQSQLGATSILGSGGTGGACMEGAAPAACSGATGRRR